MIGWLALVLIVFAGKHQTGVPEVPRHCELRNDSIMEVICQAGHDGGLQQHFVLEAIGATSTYFNILDSTRSTHEMLDNEISTMNDQVSVFNILQIFWKCHSLHSFSSSILRLLLRVCFYLSHLSSG